MHHLNANSNPSVTIGLAPGHYVTIEGSATVYRIEAGVEPVTLGAVTTIGPYATTASFRIDAAIGDVVVSDPKIYTLNVDNWAAQSGLASCLPLGASIGDSIATSDFNGSDRVTPSNPTNRLKNAQGFCAWALALCGQRVEIPPETNIWGFPSRETSQILAALPDFLAQMPRKPGFMVVECGTNNLGHDNTGAGVGSFAAITRDWGAIARYLTQRGIRVIFVPILPRGSGFSSLFNSTQFIVMDQCNRWLGDLAARSNGMVAVASQCLAPMTDAAAIGAQPLPGITGDGTHPSHAGAYQIGKAIAAILSTWYPPVDLLPTNRLTWDTGISTYANLAANPMMAGSSGTVTTPSAGTISGTPPTNTTASMSNTAGLTVAHSQVVSPLSGQRMHQMSFGGSYTVNGVTTATWRPWARLFMSSHSGIGTVLAEGDRIEAMIAFEIDAGHNCIAFPSLEMRWKGSSNYNTDLQPGTIKGGLPPETIRGVLRTPVHEYTASELPLSAGDLALSIRVFLRAEDGTYNPSGTIRFGRALIRKI